MHWHEYKTKSENKNTTNEYRCILKTNFADFNRLFVLVYSNPDDNAKGIYLEYMTGIIKNYNVIINGKNFVNIT